MWDLPRVRASPQTGEKQKGGEKDAIELKVPSLFQPEKPVFGLKQAPV